MFKRNLLNLVCSQLLQEPVQYITFYPDNKKVTLSTHHFLTCDLLCIIIFLLIGLLPEISLVEVRHVGFKVDKCWQVDNP